MGLGWGWGWDGIGIGIGLGWGLGSGSELVLGWDGGGLGIGIRMGWDGTGAPTAERLSLTQHICRPHSPRLRPPIKHQPDVQQICPTKPGGKEGAGGGTG